MRTSRKLLKALYKIKRTANAEIIDYMQSNQIKELDLTIDKAGLHPGDEDYDEDGMWDSKVWAECYGKYGNENGYISKVYLENGELVYEAVGDESNQVYTHDYVENHAYISTYILNWIENRR